MLALFAWILATENAAFKGTPIQAADLQNYEGGSNTILIWLATTGAIFLVTGAIGWFIYQRWRYQQFFALCQEKDLSAEEYGFLSSFAKKFHEKDLLSLVTKRNHFDRLVSRIAHFYEGQDIPKKVIQQQNNMLQRIRQTLEFGHSYMESRLASTRCLPINHPISILLTDRKKDRSPLRFHSSVVANDNLFLSVIPPDLEDRRHLKKKNKLPLIISFSRENDSEYVFETYIAAVTSQPKDMWVLRHSASLQKGESHRSLELSGVLTVADDEQETSVDHKIVIDHLSRDNCQFHFQVADTVLEPPFSGLLSFTFNDKEEMLRTQITDTVRRGEQLFYRTQFKTIEKDQLLRLQRVVQALRDNPDVKNGLPKGSTQSKTQKIKG